MIIKYSIFPRILFSSGWWYKSDSMISLWNNVLHGCWFIIFLFLFFSECRNRNSFLLYHLWHDVFNDEDYCDILRILLRHNSEKSDNLDPRALSINQVHLPLKYLQIHLGISPTSSGFCFCLGNFPLEMMVRGSITPL